MRKVLMVVGLVLWVASVARADEAALSLEQALERAGIVGVGTLGKVAAFARAGRSPVTGTIQFTQMLKGPAELKTVTLRTFTEAAPGQPCYAEGDSGIWLLVKIEDSDAYHALRLRPLGELAKVKEALERQSAVRPLPFTVVVNVTSDSLLILESAAKAKQSVSEEDAERLLARVDFEKEKVVYLFWSTGGPPFGVLKHEIQGKGEERRLVFYKEGPRGPRGRALRNNSNMFAVPKAWPVSFESRERQTGRVSS
jgi:hypothetical protein